MFYPRRAHKMFFGLHTSVPRHSTCYLARKYKKGILPPLSTTKTSHKYPTMTKPMTTNSPCILQAMLANRTTRGSTTHSPFKHILQAVLPFQKRCSETFVLMWGHRDHTEACSWTCKAPASMCHPQKHFLRVGKAHWTQ